VITHRIYRTIHLAALLHKQGWQRVAWKVLKPSPTEYMNAFSQVCKVGAKGLADQHHANLCECLCRCRTTAMLPHSYSKVFKSRGEGSCWTGTLLTHERGKGKANPSKLAQYGRRASCFDSRVLFFAEAQMAKQKAILFTRSARLYTRFKVLSSTAPIR